MLEKYEKMINENENGREGGFFPIGEGYTWHSGIHLYSDTVIPLLDGDIVAYRQNPDFKLVPRKKEITKDEYDKMYKEEASLYELVKKENNPQKSAANVYELRDDIREEERKEKASPNFYLIRHSLLKDKLIFYTLYNHLYPDDLKFKDAKDYFTAEKDLKEYKLPITKNFGYKYKQTKNSFSSNIIPKMKIYPGSWFKNTDINSISKLNDLFDRFTIDKNTTVCKFETEAKPVTIPMTKIDFKTAIIKVDNKEVLQLKSNQIYKVDDKETVIGTYSTEREVNYSEISNTFKVKLSGKTQGFIKDSKYTDTRLLIPKQYVGSVLHNEDNIYSLRYKQAKESIYAFSSKVSGLTKENCPLEYTVYNSPQLMYTRDINNEVIILTYEELKKIIETKLDDSKCFIFVCDNEKKIILNVLLFKKHEAQEYLSKNNYQIESNINDKYIISVKNMVNKSNENVSDKKLLVFIKKSQVEAKSLNTKIFYKGKTIVPIVLNEINIGSYVKFINNNTLFDLTDIDIFNTKPVNTYKTDAFINCPNEYKTIQENGEYYICKRYIQDSVIKEYMINNKDIQIKELRGRITGCIIEDNLMLYNNLDKSDTYGSKNPILELTRDCEFTSQNMPSFNGTQYIFNSINLGNNEKYSAVINKEKLQVKIQKRELNEKKDIHVDGKVHFCKIPVNGSDVLGFPCGDKDNPSTEQFYDVSLILEKNFMTKKIKDFEKQYYIYKKIEENKILYENDLTSNKIFFPEKTSFILLFKSIVKDRTAYQFTVKDIPVFFSNKDVEKNEKLIKYKFCKKPDTCFLDNYKVRNDRKETLYCYYAIDNIYEKYTKNFLECIGKDEVNPKYYRSYYFNAEELGFKSDVWVLEKALKAKLFNSFTYGVEIELKDNIADFRYYVENPFAEESREKAVPLTIYIPKKTKLIILGNYGEGNGKVYKIKFIKIPLTIHNTYVEKLNEKYKIIQTPKSVQLNAKTVTKNMSGELKDFSEHFFNNIDFIKRNEFDLYEEKDQMIGLKIPGNYIFTSFIWCTKEVVENKENWDNEKQTIEIEYRLKRDLTFNYFIKDPLYIYKKEHKIAKESKILRIDDNEVLQDLMRQNYFGIELADDNAKLFIPEKEADEYRTDATEWDKFFKVCETDADEDILSNIQDLENTLELTEEESKDLEKIIDDVNENNIRTDKRTSEIAEIYRKDTETKKTIVRKLRSLNVTHIHELESRAYDFLKKHKSTETEYEYLNNRCKEIEIWSKIKTDANFRTSECKNIECKNDLLTFVHPVYFLNHMEESGISNIHARELLRVQNMIVHLNNLRPHKSKKGGIWGNQAGTFCNHAVFLTIQALDKNFSNFIAGQNSIPDNLNNFSFLNKTVQEQYKNGLWISNIWCDVLEYQANNYTTGIERINEEKAKQLANQGKVVIAVWKNTTIKSSDGKNHPHYVTIAPSIFFPNIKGLAVANVGASCSFTNIDVAFDNSRKLKTIAYYYNRNQQHIYDLTKLNQLKSQYDLWDGNQWKGYVN